MDEIRGWSLLSGVCLFDTLEIALYRSFGRNKLFETNIDKDQSHVRYQRHFTTCNVCAKCFILQNVLI